MYRPICPFIQNFQGVGTLDEKNPWTLTETWLGNIRLSTLIFRHSELTPAKYLCKVYVDVETLRLLRISVIIKDFSYRNNKLGSLFITLCCNHSRPFRYQHKCLSDISGLFLHQILIPKFYAELNAPYCVPNWSQWTFRLTTLPSKPAVFKAGSHHPTVCFPPSPETLYRGSPHSLPSNSPYFVYDLFLSIPCRYAFHSPSDYFSPCQLTLTSPVIPPSIFNVMFFSPLFPFISCAHLKLLLSPCLSVSALC